MQLPSSRARAAARSRAGLTLLEVAIAAVIVASIMVVSNAAFLSSFRATEQAQDLRGVALLLDTVMEDLAAQPYSVLLTLNGNEVFDGTTRWCYDELDADTWLFASPECFVDATPSALGRAAVHHGPRRFALLDLADALLDPKRARASVAGVTVAPPSVARWRGAVADER